MEAKFARTSGLLKKRIAENPEDPLPHHYLAASYMSMGPRDPRFYEMAINEGTLALRLAARRGDEDPVYLGTHYLAAASCLKAGDAAEAERLCRSALRRCPGHLDSCFLLAEIHDRRGNPEEARRYAERYIEIRNEILAHPDRFGHIVNNNMSSAWRVEFILGKARYEMGSPAEAGAIFGRMVRRPNANPLAPGLIGGFYFKKARYREAETYLERATQIEKAKPFLYMLCECYGQNGKTDAQLRVLSALVACYPEEMGNLKRIGMAQLARSNFKVAGFLPRAGGRRRGQVTSGHGRAFVWPGGGADTGDARTCLNRTTRPAGKPSCLILPRGGDFGWGVCGTQLVKELSRLCPVRYVTEPFRPADIADELEYHFLKSRLVPEAEARRIRQGTAADAGYPVLQAAANQSLSTLGRPPEREGQHRLHLF